MGSGQLTSLDFIMSLVVFILLITTIIAFWSNYTLRFDANLKQKELVLKAITITDLFIENQGIPTNWTKDNVQVVGLVDYDRELDASKLSSFLDIGYDQAKDYLNIKAFDFYFRVVDLNGALIKAQGNTVELGNQSIGAGSIIKIRRFALYGQQKVILEFSIWE